MKYYPICFLFITLSIIVNSCSEGFKEEYLKISIVLKEVTAITTPTTDTTPDYTFSSTESGALTYGGSCSSSTTSAISGNNTITLNTLSVGPYADCTITVSKTMTTNKSETTLSGSLTITSFTVSSSDNTTTLSAPSGLTATGTAGQVSLDWSAVTSANSYTVYWDNATGISSSSTAITSVSNDNYTHSSLDNGSTYYYKVAAVDTDNTTGSLSSEVSAATPLPAPDNLSASGANNTIILTWNSVSGATSYTLYWDNVSGIDYSDTPISSITNDNYTHSNMDNGSIYYYKVAAVDSSGTGTLSSVASALLSSYVKDSASLSGHTFAITSTAMNWNNAKIQATALGGYLTTINTKAENDWLTTRFRIPYGELWIGANDIATSNTWVWDNGTTSGDNGLTDDLCGSTGCPNSDATWADNITRKWVNGEPNHSGASCGQIWQTSGPNWDDTPCNNNKYAIIEFD